MKNFAVANGYSSSSIIRIEPKATGKSVVQVMKKSTGMNVVEADAPKDSKVSRANAVSPIIESGRVFLPMGEEWLDGFLAQVSSFPNALHDDMVDCLVGMIQNETRPAYNIRNTAR